MNLNFKIVVAGLAFSLVLSSCKKEEETVVSDGPKEIILPRVQQLPTGNYVAPPQQQMQQQQQQQTVSQPNQEAIQQVVTKPGMNPPHGQAGHRCDIQVGAPLNSPKTAQPTTATTQKVTATAPTKNTPLMLDPNATPVVTEPGMNPPHGQEGHQCSVAVGAPLPK